MKNVRRIVLGVLVFLGVSVFLLQLTLMSREHACRSAGGHIVGVPTPPFFGCAGARE